MIKMGFIFARDPRGCDVARKATWQSHEGPRERLRGAEVTRDMHYLYILVLYRVIVHISIRGAYKPDESLLFLPCGTMFPTSIFISGDVASFKASDAI